MSTNHHNKAQTQYALLIIFYITCFWYIMIHSCVYNPYIRKSFHRTERPDHSYLGIGVKDYTKNLKRKNHFTSSTFFCLEKLLIQYEIPHYWC